MKFVIKNSDDRFFAKTTKNGNIMTDDMNEAMVYNTSSGASKKCDDLNKEEAELSLSVIPVLLRKMGSMPVKPEQKVKVNGGERKKERVFFGDNKHIIVSQIINDNTDDDPDLLRVSFVEQLDPFHTIYLVNDSAFWLVVRGSRKSAEKGTFAITKWCLEKANKIAYDNGKLELMICLMPHRTAQEQNFLLITPKDVTSCHLYKTFPCDFYIYEKTGDEMKIQQDKIILKKL